MWGGDSEQETKGRLDHGQQEACAGLVPVLAWGCPGQQLTLVQGGMVTFRWQRMCWVSSYFMALRRNDKNPAGSRLLSLT